MEKAFYEGTLPLREGAVYDSSLSRIIRLSSGQGFIMISAFRVKYSEMDNMKRHEALMTDVRKHDLGFIEVDIRLVEEDEVTGDPIEADELSLFIPYRDTLTHMEFFNLAMEWQQEFDQEATVYQDARNSEIWIVDKMRQTVDTIGSFSPERIGVALSTYREVSHRNRTFVFEGVRKPAGSISAMAMSKAGYIL